MKKFLFIAGIVLVAHGVYAQDSTMSGQDTSMSQTAYKKKDCYLMKDGKVMMMRHGDTAMTTIDKTATLNNGATITPDGNVKMADGSSIMLKEGQYVDIDGKMGKVKKMWPKDKM